MCAVLWRRWNQNWLNQSLTHSLRVTRSPIELSWTTKTIGDHILIFVCILFVLTINIVVEEKPTPSPLKILTSNFGQTLNLYCLVQLTIIWKWMGWSQHRCSTLSVFTMPVWCTVFSKYILNCSKKWCKVQRHVFI